jgi:hypothetical protein
MCDYWELLRSHYSIVILAGLILFVISSFYMSVNPFIFFIAWCSGVGIFIIGVLIYISEKLTGEHGWRNFYFLAILLAIMIGYPIITNRIEPKDAQSILNTYITIDIAILSVTFAAMAINPKNIIAALKKNSLVDIERFKGFIIITAFIMLMSIFVYTFTYLSSDNPLLNVSIFGITIYAFNVIFWVITFFTIILICNLMFYTSIITDEIFKNPK